MPERIPLSKEEKAERSAHITKIFNYAYSQRDYPVVEFNDYELEKIEDFVSKVIEAKALETGVNMEYSIDNENMRKRFRTGIEGEVAVFKVLGYSVDDVEMTIGHTSAFAHPDLKGLGLPFGVKTAEVGKAPLVFSNSRYGEIICMKKDSNHVVVCGLATPAIIQENSSEYFIFDHRILMKNDTREAKKVSFFGFLQLEPIDAFIERYGKNERAAVQNDINPVKVFQPTTKVKKQKDEYER